MAYNEVFERSGILTREDAHKKVQAVLDAHSRLSGWKHGEPRIIPQSDGKFKVEIPLTKE